MLGGIARIYILTASCPPACINTLLASVHYMKFSEKTEYKYVYRVKNNTCVNSTKTQFLGKVGKTQKYFDNLKDAAKWVDLYLISIKKEPVNILVRC